MLINHSNQRKINKRIYDYIRQEAAYSVVVGN